MTRGMHLAKGSLKVKDLLGTSQMGIWKTINSWSLSLALSKVLRTGEETKNRMRPLSSRRFYLVY